MFSALHGDDLKRKEGTTSPAHHPSGAARSGSYATMRFGEEETESISFPNIVGAKDDGFVCERARHSIWNGIQNGK